MRQPAAVRGFENGLAAISIIPTPTPMNFATKRVGLRHGQRSADPSDLIPLPAAVLPSAKFFIVETLSSREYFGRSGLIYLNFSRRFMRMIS